MLKKQGIKDNLTSSAHFWCYLHKDSAVECLRKADIAFFTHWANLLLSLTWIFGENRKVCCSGGTISPGGHHAVNSSHTSMLTTAWKPTSERILWIGVTFDYLSATRCVSIKDDVFYGSWSEWRICSYKHALQFSPRCEVERLSNHPFESTSQNEWTSWPMRHICAAAVKKKHRDRLSAVWKLTQHYPPSSPNNFLIISSSCQTLLFNLNKQNKLLFSFLFFCCFLLVHL